MHVVLALIDDSKKDVLLGCSGAASMQKLLLIRRLFPQLPAARLSLGCN